MKLWLLFNHITERKARKYEKVSDNSKCEITKNIGLVHTIIINISKCALALLLI
jgi:hypothetical protein